MPSAHSDETPVLWVSNYGGFGPTENNFTVAVYEDGALLEWRDPEQPSCRILGARELRALQAILERHHAVELLKQEQAAVGCCYSEDGPSVGWKIRGNVYELTHHRDVMLPLLKDLDRFFRTYLGDRNYVTPFMEIRR